MAVWIRMKHELCRTYLHVQQDLFSSDKLLQRRILFILNVILFIIQSYFLWEFIWLGKCLFLTFDNKLSEVNKTFCTHISACSNCTQFIWVSFKSLIFITFLKNIFLVPPSIYRPVCVTHHVAPDSEDRESPECCICFCIDTGYCQRFHLVTLRT